MPTSFWFWQVLLDSEYYILPVPSSFQRRSSGEKAAGRPGAWGHGATHHHLPEHAGRNPHAHTKSHTVFMASLQQPFFFSPKNLSSCLLSLPALEVSAYSSLRAFEWCKKPRAQKTSLSLNLLFTRRGRAPSSACFSSSLTA